MIGRLSSGGTARDAGLLIGAEMFHDADGLRGIVSHELVHFQQRMNEHDFSGWLYGDPPGERPADLGYFVGYRIAESYYERIENKKQAIHDILTVRDFSDFLARSGYQR